MNRTLLLVAIAFAGCSSGTAPGPDGSTGSVSARLHGVCTAMANTAVWCSTACADVRNRSNRCSTELDRVVAMNPGTEACLQANCSTAMACGTMSNLWGCDCFVQCVERESPAVQEAYAAYLECELAPIACR